MTFDNRPTDYEQTMTRSLALLLSAIMILLPACKEQKVEQPADTASHPAAPPAPPSRPAIRYGYRIVNTIQHDIGAFTQGLIYRDGIFYESTGLEGESTLRKVDAKSGKVLKKIDVPRPYFAEGMTLVGGKIYQITWRSQTCFVYDPETFAKTGQFYYDGEGWGLTDDGTTIIMSDGTATIRFIDPAGFTVKRTIMVTDNGRPVDSLNELEYINGEIWANIWQTDRIARIDPATGHVVGWVDLTGLLPAPSRTGHTDVLNGIAYDAATKKIYVTGKLWPSVFEIEVVPMGA
jgi:glutamine cyclotransferase